MRLVPYAGQELSDSHWEGRSGWGKPKVRLLHKLHAMMVEDDIPPRRRVLVAGQLLARCRRDVAREARRRDII